MASIFTYQDEPPRIQSPWSTPGTSTPQPINLRDEPEARHSLNGPLRLEPEHQNGSTEYKLHLLLRPRRKFLSTTTSGDIYPSQHYLSPSRSQTSLGPNSLSNDVNFDRLLSQPFAQARLTRLQQLTTQLLWRLQQSSPFHSSSNAELVLPVLPEATPRLGVPERPAKLLPGLEESQGALYEIGVADDGTLLGLAEDELLESVSNLQAMAASLGCTTSILRKVPVGRCEWAETVEHCDPLQTRKETLWVAEVLVYPDSRGSADRDVPQQTLDEKTEISRQVDDSGLAARASIQQMRVTLVGATAAGKSTLLGTLSTSTLDNGRGRSRLSLLKHRHEIASGITSSVAHELVGYAQRHTRKETVINYASGDVSAWTDIHNLADRLVLLTDSPGLPRYAKSALRSLISWRPSWTMLCIAANGGPDMPSPAGAGSTGEGYADSGTGDSLDLSLAYLSLCFRLQLPVIVVVTKIDLANKAGLRFVLAKVLSAIKEAGRRPLMLTNTPGHPTPVDHGAAVSDLAVCKAKDQAEVDQVVNSMQQHSVPLTIPILMTSAVTGLGISKLHTLLQSLPTAPHLGSDASLTPAGATAAAGSLFHVDEVFSIPPSRVYSLVTDAGTTTQGVVLCGHVARGSLSVGHTLLLGPFVVDVDLAHHPIPQLPTRSSSYGADSAHMDALVSGRGGQARSYQGESPRAPIPRSQLSSIFLPVRIVSLRTLRLPVMKMEGGETGTIGVQPLDAGHEATPLSRARKGMVLADPGQSLTGFHSFSARFSASHLAGSNAPVLILGGSVIIYVGSVRAAAKVESMDLDDEGPSDRTSSCLETSTREETDVFYFDGDDEGAGAGTDDHGDSRSEVKLVFRFTTTVEWMEVGDPVLVVPTVVASGPVAGPAPVVVSTGLSGFVGTVIEVFGRQ
jgi:GTPase